MIKVGGRVGVVSRLFVLEGVKVCGVCLVFSGPKSLPLLLKVAFVGGHGFRQVFAYERRCEPGPREEISSINGVAPCRHHWTECCCMQPGN